MTTLFGWFDSWRTFAYITHPPRGRRAPAPCRSMRQARCSGRSFSRRSVSSSPPCDSWHAAITRRSCRCCSRCCACRRSCPRPSHSSGRIERRPSRSRRRAGARAPVIGPPSPRLLTVLAAARRSGLVWFTATLSGSRPCATRSHGRRSGPPGSWPSTSPSCWRRSAASVPPAFAGNRRAGTRLPVRVLARLGGVTPASSSTCPSAVRGIRLPALFDDDAEELWLTLDLPSGAGSSCRLTSGARG